MDNNKNESLNNICSVEDFIERYPYLRFTRVRFEYLLRNKASNGLADSGALVRVGRAYFINVVIFRDWYSEHIKAA